MNECRAEIAGNIWKVLVVEGQQVSDGEEIITLESMKMEIPVLASATGVVTTVHIAEGDPVAEGDLLITLELG